MSHSLTYLVYAEYPDKDVEDVINEAANAAKMTDVKKQLEEVDKEEAKEKAALKQRFEAGTGEAPRLDT